MPSSSGRPTAPQWAASSPAASATACWRPRPARSPSRRTATARPLAAQTGAAVQVLSVVELPPAAGLGYAWGYGKSEQTARDDLSSSLASTVDEFGSLVRIEGKVVDGYADDELARLSTEVDLLICGSRRLGRLGRVMVGSVSTGVLRKAHCPVLVIPRGALGGFANLQTTTTRSQRRAPVVSAPPTPGRSS